MIERKSRMLLVLGAAVIAPISLAACGSGSVGERAGQAGTAQQIADEAAPEGGTPARPADQAAARAAERTAGQAPTAREELAITVHKSRNCSCCQRWVEHLRENGFEVTTVAESRTGLASVKQRLNVPRQLRTCHTATVNGYVIEGHVPAELIRRFLAEAPEALGLGTVPRMPVGSPGMEVPGRAAEPYDVVAFDKTGETTVYARRGPDGS